VRYWIPLTAQNFTYNLLSWLSWLRNILFPLSPSLNYRDGTSNQNIIYFSKSFEIQYSLSFGEISSEQRKICLNKPKNYTLFTKIHPIIIHNFNNSDQHFKFQWLLYIPPLLTFKDDTFYVQNMSVLCESQKKQRLFPYTAVTDCFW
jgi:hypothetical protein